MQAYVALGPTPPLEAAAQPGEPNYRAVAVRQCQAYIRALRNLLGREPEGACLAKRSLLHPSGVCVEVVCCYDPALDQAVAYAARCQSHGPKTWREGGVRPPSRHRGQVGRRRVRAVLPAF